METMEESLNAAKSILEFHMAKIERYTKRARALELASEHGEAEWCHTVLDHEKKKVARQQNYIKGLTYYMDHQPQ